jgi:anti-anti-sigma factor
VTGLAGRLHLLPGVCRPHAPAVPLGRPEPFELEIRRNGDRAAVVPYGDLDLATVDRVRHAIDSLVDADFADIVLDLRNLWFMDSGGLNPVVGHDEVRILRALSLTGARTGYNRAAASPNRDSSRRRGSWESDGPGRSRTVERHTSRRYESPTERST